MALDVWVIISFDKLDYEINELCRRGTLKRKLQR